ncbi:translation initiation factor eIF-2B subunit alpha-like [Paramacrobiotus metropolitanus]|uniref:translation initiation factor eIF-2B subunit alpha-like n=1 Tax=Paramacrobiotus metropolitanus TaxID=2943436 RepID=UPI002445A940|nr:translation initiation factor eIF-2B subunit alpha-like [Paramacrobiotus metropolitanus]
MDKSEIQRYFLSTMKDNPDLSPAVAAIQTLIEFLKLNSAETMVELRKNLKDAIERLCAADSYITGTSISSGCELFLRFITLAALDHSNFDECKEVLIERGNIFLRNVAGSRDKIAKYFHPFIQDGATILVHSKSRVVLQALKEAFKHRKRFHVYVTEANPDKSGVKMHEAMTECGIPSTVILDAAVGYIMEKVDLVILGAEGVVESGGIINKIGSFTVAIAAKEHNKPVFVLSESFKFVRLFPLNQRDVPNHFKYTQATLLRHKEDLSKEHPYSDYTPPSYITLLFTDLGILTPSAVSDELIRLYL